jgi:hypothetical protein
VDAIRTRTKTFWLVRGPRQPCPVPSWQIDKLAKKTKMCGLLYAGTFLGVYRSTDAGASWSRFGYGLPQVEVHDLYMPPDGSFLRIATYGRGVWKIKP